VTEYRSVLERAGANFSAPELPLERILRRRDRKRRNQRIAAGAVGIGVALAVAVGLGASTLLRSDRQTGDTRIVPVPRGNGMVTFVGPRGSGLYAVEADGSGYRLLRREAAGSSISCHPRFEGDHCAFTSPVWSPDGSRFVFLYGIEPGEFGGDRAIYVVDADGTGIRKVAECPGPDPNWDIDQRQRGRGSCSFELLATTPPSWSPDGTRLAVASSGQLFVVDVETGAVTEIGEKLNEQYVHPLTSASWSPDGTRIAFSNGVQVIVVNPDGTDPIVIGGGRDTGQIAWSPDGTRVAFSSVQGISVVSADGSDRRLVVDSGFDIESGVGLTLTHPAWSPDGKRLAYARIEPGPVGIWTIDLDRNERASLYVAGFGDAEVGGPVWSPDGTRLAFSVSFNGGQTIMIDEDGSDLQRFRGGGDPGWQGVPR
jgi:Tol biopolymer transport system component